MWSFGETRCENVGEWFAVIKVRPADPLNANYFAVITSIRLCSEHKHEARIEEFNSDEGWARVQEIIERKRAKGVIVPAPARCETILSFVHETKMAGVEGFDVPV